MIHLIANSGLESAQGILPHHTAQSVSPKGTQGYAKGSRKCTKYQKHAVQVFTSTVSCAYLPMILSRRFTSRVRIKLSRRKLTMGKKQLKPSRVM
jgi:hypothetical protein